MAEPPLHIVILGGGTAGWMAANLFAHHWGAGRAAVTLVESPEVGIIGVGEGSTPQLRAFFRTLGMAEADWMPRCNATYKAGIRFNGWTERAGHEGYFHPFATDVDYRTQPQFIYNCRARRTGREVAAHPDRFFLPRLLSDERMSPLPGESFPFDIGYGYHFDAHLVGQVLKGHALTLGVRHLERHVASVEMGPDGDIAALVTRDGERIAGDIFVDCSGFRATLIQEALGERFISFAGNLFNDRAVAMPTPRDPAGIKPQTEATAMAAGWRWAIPLTNRTGNGYVYSSRYLDSDAAETELRADLGMLDADVEARHLTMKVGRVERSWARNCLAVGLSQGFIEPLEATALHIVQATVEGFIDAFAAGGFTPQHRDDFNSRIARRYDGIRDYIVCHYRVNGRTDTEYWRDNAANDTLSDNLKTMLTAWFRGADMDGVIDELGIAPYYASASWHCLLAGYGVFPDAGKLVPPGSDVAIHDLDAVDDFLRRCALNFGNHDAALAALGGA
jgi:tryptophan 6-halogenase